MSRWEYISNLCVVAMSELIDDDYQGNQKYAFFAVKYVEKVLFLAGLNK